MATFRATFGLSHAQGTPFATDAGLPVLHGRSCQGLTELTTSGAAGTVQQSASDFAAPSGGGFVRVRCTGAVWISIGADPTAVVGTDIYLPADETDTFSLQEGDKISVIDDS